MTNQNQQTVPHKTFLLVVLLGVFLVVAAGVVYGRYSQRWGPSADLESAANRLREMPRQIGDWMLLEELDIDTPTVEMLQCAGYVNRRYANSTSGETINIAIIVGPPGPIAVHTPEICYSSRAYSLLKSKEEVLIEGSSKSSHSFWKSTFESNNATADRLGVYYSWLIEPKQEERETWTVAAKRRYRFAGEPMLYKIQISGFLPVNTTMNSNDPCRDFLMSLCQSGWSVSGDLD